MTLDGQPAGFQRVAWWSALVAVFALALALRLSVGFELEHPGHGDPAFYFDVARNLAQRGRLEIDYIWHFLSPPDSLTHPAGDYWMVGSSVLMALPLALGAGLHGAVAVAALFGVGAGLATLLLARWVGASRPVALLAAAFVLFESNLFNFSTSPNAPVFYTAFVTASLAAVARGSRAAGRGGDAGEGPGLQPGLHPGRAPWLLAGLFAGCAHATRQDGLFLMPAVALAIVATRHDWSARRRALLLASAGYLVAMAPVFVGNLVQLGAPLPSSLSRTMFARSYEDIYAYDKPLDWASYRAWGWEHIRASKLAALRSNASELRGLLGLLLWAVAAAACAWSLGRSRWSRWARMARPVALAGVFLLAVQFAFYTLVGTAVATEGGFLKAALALVPLFVVLAFHGVHRALRNWPRLRGKLGTAAAILLIAALGRPPVDGFLERARRKVRFSNQIGEQAVALRDALEATRTPADPEPVLMTRNPWELHASTGYRAVQVPNEELDTILAVAERYGVTHIVLPVPRSALTLKQAAADPRFEEVARLDGTSVRVYRLR